MKHTYQASINENLNGKIKKLINYASLLHDVDDKKFFSNNNPNFNLLKIIKTLKLNAEDVDLVIKMVNYVSCSDNKDIIPADCLEKHWLLYPRYADRLEAIGRIGIIRCWQYTKTINNPLFLKSTPRVEDFNDIWENIATLSRYNNYNGKSISMIDHYYDKLLRLGLFHTTNPYFKTIKANRISEMINVLMKFSQDGIITDDYFKNIVN